MLAGCQIAFKDTGHSLLHWHHLWQWNCAFVEELKIWCHQLKKCVDLLPLSSLAPPPSPTVGTVGGPNLFLPPSWRHAHAHFGFAHRQQPLRWLKPFLKHWYVKLYELIAPHTLKWINSVIKLGHFVWNMIYCLSRIKFKDRWVVFFIYDSFCWTKSPTAAGLGSRNDAM